ncbi:hypothetical protein BJX61DRAFT_107650 [Aspergillus egyptiacus]|nr:hypothetical protein BJX61DRAFT_107650 [Aspergillus egyptiacus]
MIHHVTPKSAGKGKCKLPSHQLFNSDRFLHIHLGTYRVQAAARLSDQHLSLLSLCTQEQARGNKITNLLHLGGISRRVRLGPDRPDRSETEQPCAFLSRLRRTRSAEFAQEYESIESTSEGWIPDEGGGIRVLYLQYGGDCRGPRDRLARRKRTSELCKYAVCRCDLKCHTCEWRSSWHSAWKPLICTRSMMMLTRESKQGRTISFHPTSNHKLTRVATCLILQYIPRTRYHCFLMFERAIYVAVSQ